MPLLEVNGLVAFRDGRALFSPITFAVARGESALITGDNGIGKTTLLNCIAGTYRDWSGQILRQSSRLSYFAQQSDCVRTLTLSQCAALTVGYSRERYNWLLQALELSNISSRLFALLSGGEIQRARLLLAMLRDHDLLLLDEPFTNVDGSARAGLSRLLDQQSKERATVLVEHETLVSLSQIKTYELRRA